MWQWLMSNLLWTEGIYIALVVLFFILLSWVTYPKFLWLFIPLFIFCFWFFRNPDRSCPPCNNDPSLVVSPTDGRVVGVETIGDQLKISIFLSVFDVHVNWIPTAGIIQSVTYRPGKFLVAFSPKSSDNNERNDVVIKATNGHTMEVRQIAGIIARRICCWVKPEQAVQTGEKFGMIRFGSRIEILVNSDAFEVYLKKGQYVYGGHTVIGKWKNND